MPTELKIPEVGESITEVEIGEWLKREGDQVAKDETVVTLESEKATVDLPAPTAGTLATILKKKGETARVGEVIARFAQAGEGVAPAATKGAQTANEKNPAPTDKNPGAKKPASAAASSSANDEAVKAPAGSAAVQDSPKPVMPAAARALAEQGLRSEEVKASGPGGRLLKEDVLRHVEETKSSATARANKAEPTPDVGRKTGARTERLEEIVPMTPLRRKMAERLVRAQQTAALLTTFNEIDLTTVMSLRKEFGEAFLAKHKTKLGFMSFFFKATIEALKITPQLNAEVRETNIVYRNYFDIGVAIGGGRGLVVPVLRQAERLSFAEIELAIADFAQRARDNKLKPDELQGGTFTISNGGIYGSLLSTPIVNPPQSGILGMHAIQERPVAREGAVVIRPMMYVAVTYDHRIVDGREAVTFLRTIKENVETPTRILLEL